MDRLTIGLIVSILCIAPSVYFLFLQKPVLKGVAYSFLPLSLLLATVCIGVIARTPKDIERVKHFYTSDRQKMQTDELPRMEKVMKTFSTIKKVEIVFFLIGLFLAIFFWKHELLKGIAIGLMIQSTMLFLFDYFAEMRGDVYLQFLESLS